MKEPCTVQAWWAHPSNLALMMVAGFGFGIGMSWPAHRSVAVEIAQDRR